MTSDTAKINNNTNADNAKYDVKVHGVIQSLGEACDLIICNNRCSNIWGTLVIEFSYFGWHIYAGEDDSQLQVSSETIINDDHSIPEVKEDTEEGPRLTDFEEKCPPGGEDSVVFYTTSLRGIRKTFEDCSSMRFVLDSLKILVQERDVSMDMEFREELWRILGGRVVPPKLFIKGRYIGGADEVFRLHEQGKLKKLLEGIPSNCLCTDCASMRFLVCSNCSGSRKVFTEKQGDELCMKCPDYNENGLVKCPVCC
ncbi:hypothetical protein GOBAR_AA07730 [Gossypium barbadense]|uniref:Glutaredoxin domain-containing protein n=1 Tax=Gossypium barbadense TaxID=3634 RepID=A0A2P5YBI0_GOSBA|nr:hypothetical protein GOBAR_AA07730 [Gossypium barbadense]